MDYVAEVYASEDGVRQTLGKAEISAETDKQAGYRGETWAAPIIAQATTRPVFLEVRRHGVGVFSRIWNER
jgi:hypothetical protein